ncbi:MAG: nicotinate-nucleotide--dimethylbenzimidazole phosphoribosyltransferase [Rhizobiaceae bacterium]|nr:nicotinate-nucleotide--dimethylbenzimidazole phosphoribosyltransferase [Rhizobiaceae bacterium]
MTHSSELEAVVQQAIDIKTKPPGSLGSIEALALQMALAQKTDAPQADPACLLLFAGDHGLVEAGVSAWPSEVTAQMVLNFLAGGAAANVFARTNGLDIQVVDAGVVGDLPDHPELIRANIRKGTRNALNKNALTPEEVDSALDFGADLAREKVSSGIKVIALGEMGIGNTSSATLLAHSIEGIDLETLTGPGAGLDHEGVSRKLEVLKQTVARRPGKLSPKEALAAFGGLEICMMAGAMIGAAQSDAIVLVDGFIASAAALVALRMHPELTGNAVFAHMSKEPGHKAMLETIGAKPLLDLDLRLGEGSGALLAFPLLRNACAMLNEMATFESAGVSGKEDG